VIIKSLKVYFKAQLLLVLINFIVFWLILNFLNVRFAVFLALLSGILSVIPVFGVLTASLFAFIVSLFDGQSYYIIHPLIEGGMILLIYIVFNQIIDFFISPFIIGRSTKLSPVVVFLAVILATSIFGVFGALFAVPFLIIVKTLYSRGGIVDNKLKKK